MIKSELDRLRTMVEKSELWVDKKGSVKGEEGEAGATKDKKEVRPASGSQTGCPQSEGARMTLPLSSAALGRGGLSPATRGEEQRELPDCQGREWQGCGRVDRGSGGNCPAAGRPSPDSSLCALQPDISQFSGMFQTTPPRP